MTFYFFFFNSIFFFIANTYTKDSLKTVQIHGKIAREGEGGGKDYWKHQFFDIEREGNGAERKGWTGPSGDRTKQKKQNKTGKTAKTL